MSMGKLKRKTSSYKNEQRDKTNSEEQASRDALAREQALALEVEDNLKRNKNLILASIAIVVFGGGFYATQESRKTTGDGELTDMFREGTMAAQGRVAKDGVTAEEGDSDAENPLQAPRFESADERLDAMTTAFAAVIKEGASTGPAHFATLGLAATALQKGDGDEAAKQLDTFLAAETKDTVFRRRALEMQAHAMEAQGKGAEGAAKLATIAQEYHEETKRLAATAEVKPSLEIDARLRMTRDHSVDLFVEAASMYRRGKMEDKAVTLLEMVTGDEELKKSNERFRAEEGLSLLGKKAG
jgi:hypothetical protein